MPVVMPPRFPTSGSNSGLRDSEAATADYDQKRTTKTLRTPRHLPVALLTAAGIGQQSLVIPANHGHLGGFAGVNLSPSEIRFPLWLNSTRTASDPLRLKRTTVPRAKNSCVDFVGTNTAL